MAGSPTAVVMFHPTENCCKHCSRIPDYWYLHEQISSIGSGAIESTVKQISRRVKISGAQWNKQNVSQVLFHRTAYLNGLLSTTGYLHN